MILMADLDGDGQVSFEEFFKLIARFMNAARTCPVGAGACGADGRRLGWRGTTAG